MLFIPNSYFSLQNLNTFPLECPDGCPTRIYDVMRDCWQTDPKHRTTFLAICGTLNDFYKSFQPVGK